ncbi:putative DNA-binding protein [Oceanobacillus caeni]|uniref:UPF0122 protein AFL42_04785 n=1 Tax=Oceanobacillus caeni TaxID=405946 RepID=A0ABR5MLN8_9BACI|nr:MULTISPECIES: putative DNA-binding protein [Bacillaceae]KKE78345.1 hypothetical protein WH51_12680 [Bacilli bacterium VT-13-104]PZD88699.1 putative DNA-binding protein [Bacilli bacterium]KPH77038.1 hypothetical protein AFL42_04785 [Oceanobacillus caeni]MBU8790120.1 putative DNA-binding protein [Oceanobacillus caeni]MCR1833279.1 putative DNA-binding protein [Oceanobacillus caeni]
MIEKTTRVNYLYDFYQTLLTSKQRNYMELYYLEDYSLGEISELHQVSRQAVYDNIKRTESMLESYEEKLHLYERFLKRASILEKMEEYTSDENILSFIQQLKELD